MAQYLSYNGSRMKKISYGGSTFRYVNFVSSNSTTTYKLATDGYTASKFGNTYSLYNRSTTCKTTKWFTATITSVIGNITQSSGKTIRFYYSNNTSEQIEGKGYVLIPAPGNSISYTKSSGGYLYQLTLSRYTPNYTGTSTTNSGTTSFQYSCSTSTTNFSFTVPDGTNVTNSGQLVGYTNIVADKIVGEQTYKYAIASNITVNSVSSSITKTEF